MSDELRDTTVVPEAKAKHPLLEFVPKFYQSFEEWLQRWKATDYLAEKLGLLHYLTGEKVWWWRDDLLLFLLEIADGYPDDSNFHVGEAYSDSRKVTAKNRQSIAKKAFAILCLKFFKDGDKESYENKNPLWWWMLQDEASFQKVLWFLREDDYWNRLRNYDHRTSDDVSGQHPHQVFRLFLRKFARLGWEFRGMDDGRRWDNETNKPIEKRLVASRPQFIDILRQLGELNWLNKQELDDASLKNLTSLAMKQDYSFPHAPRSRKPDSLEEAVLGGSYVAQLVLMWRTKAKEKARLDGLAEVEAQARELDKRRKELAGS